MKVLLHNEPFPVPKHAASQPLCSSTIVQEPQICNTAELKSGPTKWLCFFNFIILFCLGIKYCSCEGVLNSKKFLGYIVKLLSVGDVWLATHNLFLIFFFFLKIRNRRDIFVCNINVFRNVFTKWNKKYFCVRCLYRVINKYTPNDIFEYFCAQLFILTLCWPRSWPLRPLKI